MVARPLNRKPREVPVVNNCTVNQKLQQWDGTAQCHTVTVLRFGDATELWVAVCNRALPGSGTRWWWWSGGGGVNQRFRSNNKATAATNRTGHLHPSPSSTQAGRTLSVVLHEAIS
jgi:hypothetical protein